MKRIKNKISKSEIVFIKHPVNVGILQQLFRLLYHVLLSLIFLAIFIITIIYILGYTCT